MADCNDVFVYGSLLQGEANHRLLAEAAYRGTGRTAPAYRLVDLGPYPGLIAGGRVAVKGEVYRVHPRTLAVLDALEDHPQVYVRTAIRLDDGREALAYLLRPALADARPEVLLGDWRGYRRQRDRQ